MGIWDRFWKWASTHNMQVFVVIVMLLVLCFAGYFYNRGYNDYRADCIAGRGGKFFGQECPAIHTSQIDAPALRDSSPIPKKYRVGNYKFPKSENTTGGKNSPIIHGNINAPTQIGDSNTMVNYNGIKQRVLSQEDWHKILSKLPANKGYPIEILSPAGDKEAWNLGMDIAYNLDRIGYKNLIEGRCEILYGDTLVIDFFEDKLMIGIPAAPNVQ